MLIALIFSRCSNFTVDILIGCPIGILGKHELLCYSLCADAIENNYVGQQIIRVNGKGFYIFFRLPYVVQVVLLGIAMTCIFLGS